MTDGAQAKSRERLRGVGDAHGTRRTGWWSRCRPRCTSCPWSSVRPTRLLATAVTSGSVPTSRSRWQDRPTAWRKGARGFSPCAPVIRLLTRDARRSDHCRSAGDAQHIQYSTRRLLTAALAAGALTFSCVAHADAVVRVEGPVAQRTEAALYPLEIEPHFTFGPENVYGRYSALGQLLFSRTIEAPTTSLRRLQRSGNVCVAHPMLECASIRLFGERQ